MPTSPQSSTRLPAASPIAEAAWARFQTGLLRFLQSPIQRGRVLLGEVLRTCCEVECGPGGRAVEYRPHPRRCEDEC